MAHPTNDGVGQSPSGNVDASDLEHGVKNVAPSVDFARTPNVNREMVGFFASIQGYLKRRWQDGVLARRDVSKNPVIYQQDLLRLHLVAEINVDMIIDLCYPNGHSKLVFFLLANDNRWLMLRSFDYIQTRVLLDKQEQLSELERKLVSLDIHDANNEPSLLKSRSADANWKVEPNARKVILDEIEKITLEFGELAVQI